jgi:hypothetical protein
LVFLSWSLGAIANGVAASFVVMVAQCHCYWCFLCDCGYLVPLLLLLFPLWSSSCGAITVAITFFMVMAIWHHHYYYFLCGCGHLKPSLLSLLPSWSWSPSIIANVVAHVSFMVVLTFKISSHVIVHASFIVMFT